MHKYKKGKQVIVSFRVSDLIIYDEESLKKHGQIGIIVGYLTDDNYMVVFEDGEYLPISEANLVSMKDYMSLLPLVSFNDLLMAKLELEIALDSGDIELMKKKGRKYSRLNRIADNKTKRAVQEELKTLKQ